MNTFKEQLKTFNNYLTLEEVQGVYNNNAKSFISIQEINQIVDQHLNDWLETNKKSSKTFSKKACIRLQQQKFSLHIKDKKVHIFYKVKALKRKLGIQWTSVYYVSTPKGLLYFQIIPQQHCVFCYFAHFFDRFATRALEESIYNRDNSVKKFIFNCLDNKITQIYNIENKEIQICMEDGLILGHFELIDYGKEKTGRLIVCSTFLNTEMLKADQLLIWENAQAKKLKLKEPYYVLGAKI